MKEAVGEKVAREYSTPLVVTILFCFIFVVSLVPLSFDSEVEGRPFLDVVFGVWAFPGFLFACMWGYFIIHNSVVVPPFLVGLFEEAYDGLMWIFLMLLGGVVLGVCGFLLLSGLWLLDRLIFFDVWATLSVLFFGCLFFMVCAIIGRRMMRVKGF